MKRITDPTFRYTPSAQTDLRKTFARIRKEQRIAEAGRAKVVVDIGQKIQQAKGK